MAIEETKKVSAMAEEDHGSELREAVAAARIAVVEALGEGVVILDVDGRVLDVNPAAEQIMPGLRGEAVGLPMAELLPEGSYLFEVPDTAKDQCDEIVVARAGGQRVLRIRVAPLNRGDGGELRRFVLLRDVTERKRVEEELQRAKEAAEASDRAKSEFMSVASHEMRTPITSIKGYADLLAKGTAGPINEMQSSFLDTIRANANRAARLVSDLADMARIEAGRIRLELGTVVIGEVVEDAIEGLRGQIEEKQQKLTVDVPNDLPPAWADHERTVQVVSNLISNAHKFTATGGRMRVWAEPWDGEEKRGGVVVAVEDDGIGIRAEEKERVFERFYRSDDREASDAPGSGLGLSIAARLVEMQGGEIWLESRFREGTTVRFTLPSGAA